MSNQNQINRNNILRATLILLVSIAFQLTGFAQSKKISTSATIGISTPILSVGQGIHFGLNPSYRLSPRISLEAQISYSRTNVTSAFWTGEQMKYTAFNTLVGARVYLNAEERRTRFYFNALLGSNFYTEQRDELKEQTNKSAEILLGASFGFFAEFNKISVGIFGESPQNLGIKFGYRF